MRADRPIDSTDRVTTPSIVRRVVTILSHMTALALRYPSRGRSLRPLEPTTSRFGREVRGTQAPDAAMTPRMQQLRASVDRGAYDVDAGKVADAIIERLLAGRSVKEAADVLAAEARH
jgi:Anti-sigma-28 factor, FlgM